MNLYLTLSLLITPASTGEGAECPPILRAEEIEMVQRLEVGQLEVGLSKEPLQKWFESLARGTSICWELNDCGEQTGDPVVDHSRDIPICVEAWSETPSEKQYGFVIAVGTVNNGVYGKPRLRQVYSREGNRLRTLDSLKILERLLEVDRPAP